MNHVLAIAKALADRNRLRIICALLHQPELCVCQLQELLDLAPSTTSKHISILASAGMLELRKQGRWAYYRLTDAESRSPEVNDALTWVASHTTDSTAARHDRAMLDQILSISPEDLCQSQAQGLKCCSSAQVIPAVVKWLKGGPTT